MESQQYFIVEANLVTNIIMWDGNPETWMPPAGATMLISAITPAMVWELTSSKGYQLLQVMGEGAIGFTWDGTDLITNEPQPIAPPQIPVTVL